jgi:hypothetical protein
VAPAVLDEGHRSVKRIILSGPDGNLWLTESNRIANFGPPAAVVTTTTNGSSTTAPAGLAAAMTTTPVFTR